VLHAEAFATLRVKLGSALFFFFNEKRLTSGVEAAQHDKPFVGSLLGLFSPTSVPKR
jgi:hypothetical protein